MRVDYWDVSSAGAKELQRVVEMVYASAWRKAASLVGLMVDEKVDSWVAVMAAQRVACLVCL